MAKAQIHRTWPCGMQESLKLDGWKLALEIKDNPEKRPCPLHGLGCKR